MRCAAPLAGAQVRTHADPETDERSSDLPAPATTIPPSTRTRRTSRNSTRSEALFIDKGLNPTPQMDHA